MNFGVIYTVSPFFQFPRGLTERRDAKKPKRLREIFQFPRGLTLSKAKEELAKTKEILFQFPRGLTCMSTSRSTGEAIFSFNSLED